MALIAPTKSKPESFLFSPNERVRFSYVRVPRKGHLKHALKVIPMDFQHFGNHSLLIQRRMWCACERFHTHTNTYTHTLRSFPGNVRESLSVFGLFVIPSRQHLGMYKKVCKKKPNSWSLTSKQFTTITMKPVLKLYQNTGGFAIGNCNLYIISHLK